MIIGASIISARGKTIPPYAAKLIFGSGKREMMLLKAGSSNAISIQLRASGHQVLIIKKKGEVFCF
jgi:hypothetical protein